MNTEFSILMEEIFNHPNAIRACCTDPKMIEKITAMDANLEIIQKSLDQYLETKRCPDISVLSVEVVCRLTFCTSSLRCNSCTLSKARPAFLGQNFRFILPTEIDRCTRTTLLTEKDVQ